MIAKVTMKALCSFIIALLCGVGSLSAAQQWKDTIVVARDGTGDYRTLTEAMEGIRAFMDYKVTVLVKKGVYKEKVILPSWLENVDFIGENVENTIITYDDHANINKMGTFRTYTLKVEGSSITFKNLTIENNAALPILFSVLLRHCSIIARFIVKPIRTSRQLPLRKTLKWDMFLRTVS